jgi:hypothetical protein
MLFEFLSPRVFELHLTDATADELRFDFEDAEDLLLKLMSVCRGENVSIERTDLTALLSLCAALGNREVCESTLSKTGDTMTIGNVVKEILFLARHHCGIGREVEFIATHFCDFPTTLKSLPFGVIYEILSHDSLRLLNEDSLCEFIVECAAVNPEFRYFLELVRFEFCSCQTVSQVLETVCDCMNMSMWAALCRRLIRPILGRFRTREFVPGSDPLDGIIAHMTKEFGGNLHDLDLVTVTSSEAFGNSWWPVQKSTGKNVLDLKARSSFQSRWSRHVAVDARNNWICLDFKDRRIIPTHYTLRSYHEESVNNLKSWLVEVSVDGETWMEIDRKRNNEELHSGNAIATFEVAKHEECRLIRLVNIGRNHSDDDCLHISSFEIFGSLIEST